MERQVIKQTWAFVDAALGVVGATGHRTDTEGSGKLEGIRVD